MHNKRTKMSAVQDEYVIDNETSWILKMRNVIIPHPCAIKKIQNCIITKTPYPINRSPYIGYPTIVVYKRLDDVRQTRFIRIIFDTEEPYLTKLPDLPDIDSLDHSSYKKLIDGLKKFGDHLKCYIGYIDDIPNDFFAQHSIEYPYKNEDNVIHIYTTYIDICSIDEQKQYIGILSVMLEKVNMQISVIETYQIPVEIEMRKKQTHKTKCNDNKCMNEECQNYVCDCDTDFYGYVMDINGVPFSPEHNKLYCYSCMMF